MWGNPPHISIRAGKTDADVRITAIVQTSTTTFFYKNLNGQHLFKSYLQVLVATSISIPTLENREFDFRIFRV